MDSRKPSTALRGTRTERKAGISRSTTMIVTNSGSAEASFADTPIPAAMTPAT